MAADAVVSYERTGETVAIELRGLDPVELMGVLAGFWTALPPPDRVAMVSILEATLREYGNAPIPDDEEELMTIIQGSLTFWHKVLTEMRA